MSTLKLYNTLSRKTEDFMPLKPPHVGLYTCGPTVYDYQHIGNFRTMVLSDTLQRVLKYNGYDVKAVRNITDIDDKIIKNASERGIPIGQYSSGYTKVFFEDARKLNIQDVDVTTYATKYVEKMVVYIQALLDKGYAYIEPDGSVYFAIAKFNDYGRLSRLDKQAPKTGTKVLSDEYTKENAQDFALWKATKAGETQSYDSPWGKGRPGWHIECSVMSQDNLGETFDIHVGGVDLIFPHHENEIAQSEAKTGKPFVNYWIHGEFLQVDSQKMSKSLKNFYTLKDIQEKGFDPLALRYFYLTSHYRTILNFTWEAQKGAQNALKKLQKKVSELKLKANEDHKTPENIGCAGYEGDFLEAINDDLNTPEGLAVVWKLVDDTSMPGKARLTSMLRFDRVLGLKLDEVKVTGSEVLKVPEEVQTLLDKRQNLRQDGKFAEADKVREEVEKMGYTIEDTEQGPKINKQ